MNRSFDELLAEAWSRLKPLRQATVDEPKIEWWKLSELTSTNKVLCGLSLFQKGWLWKRKIGEICLAYDGHDGTYKVSAWRKYHHPLVVYPGEGSQTLATLEQAVNKIEEMVEVIRPFIRQGNLEKSFPAEWIGKRLWK